MFCHLRHCMYVISGYTSTIDLTFQITCVFKIICCYCELATCLFGSGVWGCWWEQIQGLNPQINEIGGSVNYQMQSNWSNTNKYCSQNCRWHHFYYTISPTSKTSVQETHPRFESRLSGVPLWYVCVIAADPFLAELMVLEWMLGGMDALPVTWTGPDIKPLATNQPDFNNIAATIVINVDVRC